MKINIILICFSSQYLNQSYFCILYEGKGDEMKKKIVIFFAKFRYSDIFNVLFYHIEHMQFFGYFRFVNVYYYYI